MSRGIRDFQPLRLAQVLAARRLSQAQLALMVGVSPPTISKWRSGLQAPEVEALERLASVVNVSPEWFTRQPSPPLSPPLFRSNASAHVAARSMLEARLELAQDVALGLSEFVDFPAVSLPCFAFTRADEIGGEEIELAATACRELWRLGRGPIPDLALAAEGAGVLVVREEAGVVRIEGLSAWSSSLGHPFVYLCADKDNGFRSRFDLAHELGHLVLHRHLPKATDNATYNLIEKQAHAFAGALLLPAETFACEVRTPVTLDSLLLLKQRWGVSVGAIIMRLEALGIIDAEEKSALFKRRSARWGAQSEPGDSSRAPEQPRLMRRSIELLLTSGIMTRESLRHYFGLSATELESLACLPTGFLQGPAEVVELAKLRQPGSPPKAPSQPHRESGATVVAFPQRPSSSQKSS